MQEETAAALAEKFREAGFVDVRVVRAKDPRRRGYLLTGRGYVSATANRRVVFSIRSPRMTRSFLFDYRSYQADRIEVPYGLA